MDHQPVNEGAQELAIRMMRLYHAGEASLRVIGGNLDL
jgi:hypothetical protein